MTAREEHGEICINRLEDYLIASRQIFYVENRYSPKHEQTNSRISMKGKDERTKIWGNLKSQVCISRDYEWWIHVKIILKKMNENVGGEGKRREKYETRQRFQNLKSLPSWVELSSVVLSFELTLDLGFQM